jgi:hypothetical protein
MGSLSKSGARSPRNHPLRPAKTNPARYNPPITGAAISVPIPAATIAYTASPPTKLPITANIAARTARPRSRLQLGIFVTRCAARPKTRATPHWKTARNKMNRATMNSSQQASKVIRAISFRSSVSRAPRSPTHPPLDSGPVAMPHLVCARCAAPQRPPSDCERRHEAGRGPDRRGSDDPAPNCGAWRR